MSEQIELDGFVEKWGGRAKVYELMEAVVANPGGAFAEELNALIQRNSLAMKLTRDALGSVQSAGTLGNQFVRPFQGTPETWGASTDDAFFKAKSPEYLRAAESSHDTDAAARNEEEGWPDDGRDIGDA